MSGVFSSFMAEGISTACFLKEFRGAGRVRSVFLTVLALTGVFCVSAKASYQVQVEAVNGEASWEYNIGTTGGNGSVVAGGTSSGTTDTTGLATNAVADASDSISSSFGPLSSVEHGASNLATGMTVVSEYDTGQSETAFGSDGGTGQGLFSDTLHFTVQAQGRVQPRQSRSHGQKPDTCRDRGRIRSRAQASPLGRCRH